MRLKSILLAGGAVAVVMVAFFGTLWLMDRFWDYACPKGRTFVMKPPFGSWGGFSYTTPSAELEASADSSGFPLRSRHVICEDNWVIGPSHSRHADIVNLGAGRFSHWESLFVFSTSDNSNPNTNGRKYVAVTPN